MRFQFFHAFVAGAVAIAVVATLTANGPAGDPVYFAAYAVVCVTALVAAIRQRRRADRRPWLWIALSQFAWFAGDSVWPVTELLSVDEPFGLTVALWSAGYVAYGIALVGMARRRAGRRLLPAVLDMAALTTAVAIAIWLAVISPFLAEAAADPLYTYSVLMAAVGDVIILAGVLLVVFSPGTRGGATVLLVIAALLRIVADIGMPFDVSAEAALAMSGVILLSNALVAVVGLHRGHEELTTPAPSTRTLHPIRVWFLGFGLLTTPAMTFAVHGGNHAGERAALFAATIATSVIILVRFAGAVRSLERAERQLSHQATHDALTGLVNRAALTQRLAELPDAIVLYLDLDGFKAVNDTIGHAAGDAVLREVAARLRAAVRAGDTVARLGGDEFVVLLPGADIGDATALAERILHDIALPVAHEAHHLMVGTSIGIARPSRSADGGSELLLRAADSAMYRAKRLGRGRWVIADAELQAA